MDGNRWSRRSNHVIMALPLVKEKRIAFNGLGSQVCGAAEGTWTKTEDVWALADMRMNCEGELEEEGPVKPRVKARSGYLSPGQR